MNNTKLSPADIFAAIAIGLALTALALAWFDVLVVSSSSI